MPGASARHGHRPGGDGARRRGARRARPRPRPDHADLRAARPGLQQLVLLFMFGALDPSRQDGKLPDSSRSATASARAASPATSCASASGCSYRRPRSGSRRCPRPATSASAAASSTGRGRMFPASSPFVTGVGGTDLKLTPTQPDRAPGRLVDVRDRPEPGRRDRRRAERRVRPPGLPAGAGHQLPRFSGAGGRASSPMSRRWPRSRPASSSMTRAAVAGGSAAERAPRRH